MIALLGKRDIPTDGVDDYCIFLGRALAPRGIPLEMVRVNWESQGWREALRRLRQESANWRGEWVLLQYTALGWSRHGFPFGVLVVLRAVRRAGARCAVIFHEPCGLGGPRAIDQVRCACQNWVVRKLYQRAQKSILTAPLKTIPWLDREDTKAVFVPIGANIPEPAPGARSPFSNNGAEKTVAVFCLDTPPHRRRQLDEIAYAVKAAATSGTRLRVLFVGKGTPEAQAEIAESFRGLPVEVQNLGIRPPEEVSRALAQSDVMISIRGQLYPRRGSILAGICCGLPIIGYAGKESISPLDEAGVQAVPAGSREDLAAALCRVLSDDSFREQLRARSREAHRKYFSWEAVSARLCDALGQGQSNG